MPKILLNLNRERTIVYHVEGAVFMGDTLTIEGQDYTVIGIRDATMTPEEAVEFGVPFDPNATVPYIELAASAPRSRRDN